MEDINCTRDYFYLDYGCLLQDMAWFFPHMGRNPCQTRTKQQIMRNFCYSCVIRQKSHCVKRSKGLNEIRNFCLPVT